MTAVRWYGVLHLRICKSYLLKTDSNGEAFRHKHSRNLIAWRVLLETPRLMTTWKDYLYCDKCDFETKLSNCLGKHDRIKKCDIRFKCKIGYGLIVKVVTTNTLQKLILEFIFSHSTRV